MTERRGVYFAFQGLLTAVLLLLILYYHYPAPGWAVRFALILGAMLTSLVFIRLAPARVLDLWWVQMSLFVGDAVLASATLHWTARNEDIFPLYFLIIFGTALSRSLVQSVTVAAATSLLFLFSSWHPVTGLPHSTGFWLKLHFLWIITFLLAILSRDTQQAQAQQKRQYQERIIQLESLATLGRVAGEVAHRIKGPLTTIRVNAEVLSHRLKKPAKAQGELAEIQEEVERCKAILKDLLSLGRIEEIDFSRIDLRKPLRSALESLQTLKRGLKIKLKLGPLSRPLMVQGDQSMLHEAILAVLHNAFDAAGSGGRVEVAARTLPQSSSWWRSERGKKIHAITIRDEGKGVSSKDLENIFRPFYTTKKEGSGLGLSAALRILQKHGGTIDAYSEGKGKGAAFTLMIPGA